MLKISLEKLLFPCAKRLEAAKLAQKAAIDEFIDVIQHPKSKEKIEQLLKKRTV